MSGNQADFSLGTKSCSAVFIYCSHSLNTLGEWFSFLTGEGTWHDSLKRPYFSLRAVKYCGFFLKKTTQKTRTPVHTTWHQVIYLSDNNFTWITGAVMTQQMMPPYLFLVLLNFPVCESWKCKRTSSCLAIQSNLRDMMIFLNGALSIYDTSNWHNKKERTAFQGTYNGNN